MFRNVHFVRVMGIKGLVDRLQLTYGITSDALGIPHSVLEYDMNLIPISVLNQFYENIEGITGDPDAVLTLVRQMDLSKLGSLSHWFFAGHDLATTIRRINSGITCIQSGAFFGGEIVGPIVKWTYRNDSIIANAKAQDGVRVANFMLNVLRHYLGKDFTPDRVCFPVHWPTKWSMKPISGAALNGVITKPRFGYQIAYVYKAIKSQHCLLKSYQ
ncbi:AraC-type DNA-binding domain-containing protein [Vibrio variabilis]|uniref:AraC-type DNA-binding domain-containing protein n=1 Tax=Vibrio variabilis TaxID=990271 RepID=A0ABQ0J7H8_9VIBR|nr:AraC-type DNA-binding domain-containing protein [Vibrio variabilis]